MILAGDIGGTKTHLAFFDTEGTSIRQIFSKSYHSREYRSLGEVLADLLSSQRFPVTSAAFGIAGPIVDGRSKLTNLGWDVVAAEIASQLGLRHVGLLNDLAATAYGTLRLSNEDMIVLQEGTVVKGGTVAVIAAGTGLGEGGLFWDGTRYLAIPSEGGHTDFGPRNELEIDLLRYLLRKYDRVSYERVVAGPGLCDVYRFLRARSSSPEPAWLAEEIRSGDPSAAVSKAALEGKDDVCSEALELFVSLYGAEAGNLALKLLATGGVYVGGGIAPKILGRMTAGSFMDSFVRKGRYEGLLRKMPVRLVLNETTALLGAAHYAQMLHD